MHWREAYRGRCGLNSALRWRRRRRVGELCGVRGAGLTGDAAHFGGRLAAAGLFLGGAAVRLQVVDIACGFCRGHGAGTDASLGRETPVI